MKKILSIALLICSFSSLASPSEIVCEHYSHFNKKLSRLVLNQTSPSVYEVSYFEAEKCRASECTDLELQLTEEVELKPSKFGSNKLVSESEFELSAAFSIELKTGGSCKAGNASSSKQFRGTVIKIQ